MQNKYVINLCFILSMIPAVIAAQRNPYSEVTVSSPSAASLGKYADFPVGYHTGIPQINIPIYSAKSGTVELPVSLTYHASGLKVSELSSWVGTGWSLNAGGVITRAVQGSPDERNTSYNNNEYGHLSNGGYNQYLFTGDQSSPLSPKEVTDFNTLNAGIKDAAPDLFFYNFAGFTGKFYFHDDGTPVIVPQQDLKITYDYTPGANQSIKGFTITTSDGNRYLFGKTPETNDTDPVEITHFFDEDGFIGTNQTISSWYLNKIVSADGLSSIILKYTAEEYKYLNISAFPVPGDDPSVTYEYKLYEYWIQGVRLSEINFANGQIIFEPGANRLDLNSSNAGTFAGMQDYVNNSANGAKELASISITDQISNGFCKKFVFNYGYFYDSVNPLPGKYAGLALNVDRKRLKLNSIQEQSCDAVVSIPAHIFDYFTEPVPRRLSFAQDHWGFNNGQNSNQQLIPTYQEESTGYGLREIVGANRESNWPAMRAGALKKIIYPTGGSTEFVFEANTTFVSYQKNVLSSEKLGFSAGFDNELPVDRFYTFNGNLFQFHLSSTSTGGTGVLTIYNSSDQVVHTINAAAGTSTDVSLRLTSGTYKLRLVKMNRVTNSGANATLKEWTPTQVDKNEVIGGLRIRSMIHRDGITTKDIVTNYEYTANNKSTGILYSRPTYVQVVRNDFLKQSGPYTLVGGVPCSANGCTVCDVSTSLLYVKSPNSIRPMETTQGNHIGYNEVRVSKTGNGYSIYRYYGSNIWDNIVTDVATRYVNNTACNSNIPNFPEAPRPFEFMRGELKFEGHYNEAGAAVKETTFYPEYQENQVTTPAIVFASVSKPMNQLFFGMSTPPNSGMTGMPTFYELKTAKKIKNKSIEWMHSPGVGYIETITEYFYDSPSHNELTRMTTTNSKNEVLDKKYRYAKDYMLPACSVIPDGSQAYENDMTGCLLTYNNQMANCTDKYCRYWNYQQMLKCKSDARKTYRTTRINYYNINISNSFADCRNMRKYGGTTELRIILELQDLNINALIETTEWRANKLITATFNKFDFFANNPTVPFLSQIQKINLAAPSSLFSASSASDFSFNKDTRYAIEMSFQYRAGRLAEVNPPSGVKTSYVWGYNNTVPIIRAKGIDIASLENAYTLAAGNLAILRNQPGLGKSLIQTYEYHPLKGITKESDPNARSISYEYDKIGRLELIRNHEGQIIKTVQYQYQVQQ